VIVEYHVSRVWNTNDSSTHIMPFKLFLIEETEKCLLLTGNSISMVAFKIFPIEMKPK